MGLAEIAAAAVAVMLAAAPLVAYLADAAGLGVSPGMSFAGALAAGAASIATLQRGRTRDWPEAAAWLGIVLFVVAILLRLSPSLVPPGRGPDLTHHLLLVDYIEQNWHLVHDRSLDGAMGEMAHYTPAAHLLAVLGGSWFGGGLRAFFPLVVFCTALSAGFLFLIGRRGGLALPYAIVAVLMLFLPAQYFFGGFTHDGFLAQAVATLFALAMWWAIAAWDDWPTRGGAAIVAVFLCATFLSWPVFLGPPLIVFAALLLGANLSRRERSAHAAIVVVPFVLLFLVHSWHRWGWMVIVRTSGAVLHPSVDSLGWLLPMLAAAGVVAAARDRRARVTIVLLVMIVLQGVTLYAIAKAQGAHTPYMAFKMVYLAIYPLALLAAYAAARASRGSRSHAIAGWLFASVLLIVAVRPAVSVPRAVPVVDLDLHAAGRWLRASGGGSCADYLVADAETAYWLHLGVLGNPRSGERMQELDRYEPRAAMAPWITAEGRRFAVADLRLLPDELRRRVSVVAQYGRAGVITRPGAKIEGCD